MGAPEPMVKGIGLLANLSIFNATVDFESLQELLELIAADSGAALDKRHRKRTMQELTKNIFFLSN